MVGYFGSDTLDIILAFVIGLILTPIIASAIEWAGHRYICHNNFKLLRRIYSIHLSHHLQAFSTERPVEISQAISRPMNYLRSLQQGNATYLTTFGFYTILGAMFIWVPAGLLSKNASFLAGVILGTLVISNLFIVVHNSIHNPGAFLILERQKWFGALDRRHRVHHTKSAVNFNLLFPLADWILGTYAPIESVCEIETNEFIQHLGGSGSTVMHKM